MANIKVHILNFHGIWSHIEIVLENTSTEHSTYYGIDRWTNPSTKWSENKPEAIIQASSIYSFDINADPNSITKSWWDYWYGTEKNSNIFGENCAAAAQWFLTKFADIPKPDLFSNVSANHLAFGIMWPSFVPCPVTLPGRVISNAKFHMEAKIYPEIAAKYTHKFLYASMAVATMIFATSVSALAVAATILTGGIMALAIAGCVVVGLASSYVFFKAYNTLSTKNITDKLTKIIEDKDTAFNNDLQNTTRKKPKNDNLAENPFSELFLTVKQSRDQKEISWKWKKSFNSRPRTNTKSTGLDKNNPNLRLLN